MDSFKALRCHAADKTVDARIEQMPVDELSEGSVLIRAAWSGINFKDALAVTGAGKIMRSMPMNAGIDVAGTVETSEDPRFRPGEPVLVTGCGLGEARDGGFAEFTRVPADSVVPIPDGWDARQVMAIGTAGFTAAMALVRMEQNGQHPDLGPILVNGASGGVGSYAIRLFHRAGYQVTALTGKANAADYLRGLGASDVLLTADQDLGKRPLERALWGGAVDSLGGEQLTWLTRTVQPWGNIGAVGLAAGIELNTTVMPFILRGVSLLGINSVECARDLRLAVWRRVEELLEPADVESVVTDEVGLDGVLPAAQELLERKRRGRTLVRIAS
ncbi:YhdH/YhfP family quinone oxidoreductase [Methylonatrum kenyense]|uniref:YhdH/YhfP family quinone oxidoreductase n=1 Tax=Methylonatrum kenyense TaxID=455253 RepID=UPI0020BF5899|nr:YhdH/YhfP family quinone oxidoreductase [Methylonatrum kenyense]MCK8515339.1 YhdH/YhfP family quinone oxidoreductase [Methylonatrum kenyense]